MEATLFECAIMIFIGLFLIAIALASIAAEIESFNSWGSRPISVYMKSGEPPMEAERIAK